MAYGSIKVDNIIFTNGGADETTTVSGIYKAITSGVTVSGTISGTTIQGQTISGVTVTGTTANFVSGVFTTQISGATITGNTGSFSNITGVSGVFTTLLSGTTVTGTTAQFTNITGGGIGATTITGTTVTGTTANFVSGVFTTQISGATVTGTTANFTSGNFTALSGASTTVTSGIFAAGSAAAPSISFASDPNTGIYSPGADQLAFSTGGSERARIDSSGRLLVGTSSDTGAHTLTLQGNSTGPVEPGVLSFRRNRALVNDDIIGLLEFSDNGNNVGANIQAVANGTWNQGTTHPSRLVFSTTADGETTPTERLRITSADVLQVADAGNITVGTTTGTKIGTATTQKLGFYNATPVVQPTAVADATTAIDVITQLNALLAKLRTLGIIAT